MKEAMLYQKLENGKTKCAVCNHRCMIAEGKRGICGVRENQNGRLYSLVYGKAAALAIDPVEKKPLFHFLPGSFAFSFGTLGCNFSCLNCQNWEISQLDNQKGEKRAYSRLFWGENLTPSQIVSLARQNQCLSIAYTYNEPTVFLEYALETMKLARRAGLKNIWVSNGFMSDKTLDLILPYLDADNIDIKSSEEKMDVKKIENFLRKKDDTVTKDSSVLSKWENEINYFLDKNIKQKIIIEFILENDEEIRNKYANNYSNIQSMMSKFCAKLKKSKKRRNKSNESNVDSSSSEEELKNIDSGSLTNKPENNINPVNMFQSIMQKNEQIK